MVKLNSKQLRVYVQDEVPDKPEIVKNEIYIVLDNVLDTYNIGAVFRLADAIAAKRIYLCGGSQTPPNHRIKKSSINTTEWVQWRYKESALEAIAEIREESPGVQIVAVEQSRNSVPYDRFEYRLPVCLVVGHESEGVSKEVLETADATVELPMYGVNVSLNVMVSLSIVAYKAVERCISQANP